ncbi:MAG TPA: hypothetical protein IAA17_07325 [Candidatus Lachnoclostridium stercorigallinarum]|uniref:Lipoprotein n=1 Tax=Candidatus Lachnoclostridium stercorigallinarum TaxID=2838634 RepID=A0A9D2K5P3_9FIRM|nr:hypothetical protein [Candidatus Lachnoclostridium stercorigallinarum]
MRKSSGYGKKWILLLTAACLVTSCRTGRELPAKPVKETAVEETAGERTADSSDLVLIPGYGAVKEDGAAILVPEELPEPLVTDGAKAWLWGAFYQDGRLGFRVLMEDRSLKGEKDGAGETKASGYDSPFLDQRAKWKEKSPDWEGFYQELENRTFSLSSASVGQFEDGEGEDARGIVTLQGICEMGGGIPEEGLSGEIRVDGFETGFPVRFVRAREKMELTEGDRALFAAEGRVENGRLTAAVYTIPREGDVEVSRLTAMAGGEPEGEMTALWRPSGDRHCPQGLEGNFSIWQGPLTDVTGTSGNGSGISLKAEQAWVHLEEETKPVVIPVPEEKTVMNERVELENAVIAFGTVERTEEGTESGEPLSLSVEVDVTSADDNFLLVSFYGIVPGTVWEGDGSYTREGLCLTPDQENGWQEAPEQMRIVYEEGEQEVTAELTGFTYLWNCGTEIPAKEMPQDTPDK